MGNVKQIYEIRNVAYCRMWHIAAPAGEMPSTAMLYSEISDQVLPEMAVAKGDFMGTGCSKAGGREIPERWERTSGLGPMDRFFAIFVNQRGEAMLAGSLQEIK
jgi:hypothetical protein